MRRFSPRKQGENLIRPGRFFRLAAPQADGRIGFLLSSSFVRRPRHPTTHDYLLSRRHRTRSNNPAMHSDVMNSVTPQRIKAMGQLGPDIF